MVVMVDGVVYFRSFNNSVSFTCVFVCDGCVSFSGISSVCSVFLCECVV